MANSLSRGNRSASLHAGRSFQNLAAFIFGLPAGAGIIALFRFGVLNQTAASRYLSHPVECVEVVMFCCAVGALGFKLLRSRMERRACNTEILKLWDGQPVPVADSISLSEALFRLPRHIQGTCLVRRVNAVLEFLVKRQSAKDLDDHLRTLADNDALALDGSYSLTRFITWAIPILGFLGTVLGITQAISGVTPEVLEKSLSTVTDGLALAFDTTALGLALTMITMFMSFIVERIELGVLETVDRYTDAQLAHRFERFEGHDGDYVGALRQNTNLILQMSDQLVQRQATVWAKSLDEIQKRHASTQSDQQKQLTKALSATLDETQAVHSRRLAELGNSFFDQSKVLIERLAGLTGAITDVGREQQTCLGQGIEALAKHTKALGGLQEGEKHLIRLQDQLNRNLTSLAGAGAFEEAVHNLTAAIHLLTARASPVGTFSTDKAGLRPGAAA